MKFEVGQRVRHQGGGFGFGEGEGTVTVGSVSGEMGCWVRSDVTPDHLPALYFYHNELELIEENKMDHQKEVQLELGTYETDVDDLYNQMSEGARCHMMNKLFKAGYRSPKMFSGKVVNIDGVDYRLVRDGE